jgi:hypothetical protein
MFESSSWSLEVFRWKTKRVMKKWVLLLIIILLYSCKAKEESTLYKMKSDDLLSASFTKSELKDLATIVDFFETQICDEYNDGKKENLKDCYDKFNIKDKIAYSEGTYFKFIDIEAQRKMYKKLDSTTVYEIWRHGRCYPDSLKTPINLGLRAWDGNYHDFLVKAGKEHQLIKEYVHSMSVANGLSPGNISMITHNYDQFDINDSKIRLLFAIHYLSLNEDLDFRLKKPCY